MLQQIVYNPYSTDKVDDVAGTGKKNQKIRQAASVTMMFMQPAFHQELFGQNG